MLCRRGEGRLASSVACRKMPGIEIFGGYLPVYHDRKGLTKIAGDCKDKMGRSD